MDATSAAQIAQQTRNLQKVQKEIDDRVALLTAKAEVLKSWMKLREEFVARATESLVQIYSKMKTRLGRFPARGDGRNDVCCNPVEAGAESLELHHGGDGTWQRRPVCRP